jgi:hypothetical protein
MWRNYFEVNGKKYYTGTVFLINHAGKQKEASFICYDERCSMYVYRTGVCTMHASDERFWRSFVSITNKHDNSVHVPRIRRKNELDIDGMFLGWTWYIFLMLISCIFKSVIGLWAIISIVFFSWRSEKIKEEGTYIEW